jgi:hypothetical protein
MQTIQRFQAGYPKVIYRIIKGPKQNSQRPYAKHWKDVLFENGFILQLN